MICYCFLKLYDKGGLIRSNEMSVVRLKRDYI